MMWLGIVRILFIFKLVLICGYHSEKIGQRLIHEYHHYLIAMEIFEDPIEILPTVCT